MISLISCHGNTLQKELERLLQAAKDGNISDLHYLLEDDGWDVNTRGPYGHPWVSCTVILCGVDYRAILKLSLKNSCFTMTILQLQVCMGLL